MVSAPSVDLEPVAELPEDKPDEFDHLVAQSLSQRGQHHVIASPRLSDEAVGTAICSGVLTLVCVNGVPENKRLLGSVFRTTTDLFMALYSLKCPGKTVACLNLKNFSVTQHHQQTGVLPGDCIFHLQERGVDAALSFTFRCSSEDEAQRWVRSAGYVTPAPRRASLCQVSLPSVEEAPEFLQPVSASHHFLHGSAAAVAAAARGGD